MTYEKFEHKVLGLLLEGDDPRLDKLISQTWDMEVLSRDETNMGFTVKFLAPALLTIGEPEGRVFGVEVKLSETETINIELIIKNGLIDRLKGVFSAELTYSEVIKRYADWTFSYKNGNGSEMTFHSDNHEPDDGVTFVKNIATISKEIDAHISKTPTIEDDIFAASPIAITDIHEDEVKSEQTGRIDLSEKTVEEPLIEEPFTLEPEEAELETTVEEKEEDQKQQIDDGLDQEEEPLIEEPFTLTSETEVESHEEEIEVDGDEEAESVEEDLLAPPSFSIPKVPDAIRKRWVDEVIPARTFGHVEALPEEDVVQTDIQKELEKKIELDNMPTEESSIVGNVLDGKAPQGPVTFVEQAQQEVDIEEVFDDEEEYEQIHEDIDEEIEFDGDESHEDDDEVTNLTPQELSNPNLETKNPVDIQLDELESAALSAVDEEEVERSIMMMQKRTKEIRILACIIVIVTLLLLFLIFSLASS